MIIMTSMSVFSVPILGSGEVSFLISSGVSLWVYIFDKC